MRRMLDALIALAARKAAKFGARWAMSSRRRSLDGLMALAQSRAGAEVLDAGAIAARDAALDWPGLKTALGSSGRPRAPGRRAAWRR